MKKETLEEVAQWVINNRYARSELEKVSDFEMYNTIIDKCSKLQKEQDKSKYSEEDMQDFAKLCLLCKDEELPYIFPKDWFKHIKNKIK